MTTMPAFSAMTGTLFLERLDCALQALTEKDTLILKKGANERAISFRLAMHLQALFPEWEVDCEYNCWETSWRTMQLAVTSTDAAATEARTIYPDIVIHRRGTSENLAAIEVSKSSNDFGKHQDIKKLKAYKARIGYEYAVLLNIGVGDDIDDNRIDMLP